MVKSDRGPLRLTVAAAADGERLDRVLAAHFPEISRTRFQAMIADGAVTVGGEAVREPRHGVREGDEIVASVPEPVDATPEAEAIPLAIVHEDRDLVVIDKPAPGLQRLIWSKETDLALALLDDRRKLVYLGFDLARSNFPLQAAFPLFFTRSLEWLRPRGDGFVSTHIAAGSTRTIALPASETRVIMRMPSGKSETLEAEGSPLLFDATANAGIYEYTVGDVSRYFAVSLTDARESDVNSRRAPIGRHEETRPAGNTAQALVPLWPQLLVLALILLALEWFVWTRSRANA